VQSHVKVFTMCGRQFVRHLLGRPLPSEVAPEATPSIVAPVRFHHVVMNLPATAIEFLGAPRTILPPIPVSVRDVPRLRPKRDRAAVEWRWERRWC
jgi:hypothetical protein